MSQRCRLPSASLSLIRVANPVTGLFEAHISNATAKIWRQYTSGYMPNRGAVVDDRVASGQGRSLAHQKPKLDGATASIFDVVLFVMNRQIPPCINAPDHSGAVRADDVKRFFKTAGADLHGVFEI